MSQDIIAKPFDKADELQQKRTRFNEVMELLAPKNEQQLGNDSEDAQYQSRDYIDEDKPRKYNKHSRYNETETLFNSWANSMAPVGETKRFFRFGEVHYYEKAENGCVELSRAQYEERVNYNAKDSYRRAKREVSEIINTDEYTERDVSDRNDGNRDTRRTTLVRKQTLGEELRNDGAGSESGIGRDNRRTSVIESSNDDYAQNQQRDNSLSDREIIELAANEIKIEDLTDGEKDALQIYKDRLTKLEDLQKARTEQGRLYRELQFGEKITEF